ARREGDAAAIALVGAGRVGESRTDHGPARGESGLDHLADELMARGIEQESVNDRVDLRPAGSGRSEEDVADALPEDRAAGLTGRDDRDAAGSERRLEAGRLGGLAGTLRSLEGDEAATDRRAWASHRPSVRPGRAERGGAVIRIGAPGVPSASWDAPSILATVTASPAGSCSGLRPCWRSWPVPSCLRRPRRTRSATSRSTTTPASPSPRTGWTW